jgi:sulfate permease, SulP family
LSRPAVTELRWNRHEIAGGLGDSGLLIPIAIAMVTVNGLNATAVFAGVGLAYIGTAVYFGVPVPVQPLKAFAAAAIALGLHADVLAAGALLMAAAMALLGLTGAAGWLAARFPVVLVRGIQASVALPLVKAAVELAERGNWADLPAIDPDLSIAMAIVCCGLLLAWRAGDRLPGALAVLGAGAIVGVAVSGLPSGLDLGPQAVGASVPDGAAFATALTTLVLAQIPLTFGNSVVATVDAERTYFGERAWRVRPRAVAGSIALNNTLAGVIGGLPVCHGAGGVTAHYRLGARSAAATLFAGSLLLALALVFGAALPEVLVRLAPGALAGMLLYVAIQHGLLASQLDRASERVVAAGVGAITLLSGNLAIGFGAGVAALALRWATRRAIDRAGLQARHPSGLAPDARREATS